MWIRMPRIINLKNSPGENSKTVSTGFSLESDEVCKNLSGEKSHQ